MGARMIDIARDLGVSLMTVSKALRSHTDISEETRKRVMKRARELDLPAELDCPEPGDPPHLRHRPW